jgi:predicted TIM-barrel fold metal-dependent hydrolase
MTELRVIDADTHVDESEATWEYIDSAVAKHAPINVTRNPDAPTGTGPDGPRWWLVGNRIQPRVIRDDAYHPSRERRELEDVPGRLADMDRMSVDVQVMFPTFFIRNGPTNPVAEQALARSYNRWIADRCAQSNGRLRWAAVLPLLDPDMAVEELRWAKQNGACAVFKRGFDLEKSFSDPHFFPVYQEANDLDIAICIHTGHPLPGREWDRSFPVIAAFNSIIMDGLPDKFPNLRFGFVEAGASWIPYSLAQMATHIRAKTLHERKQSFELTQDLLRQNRLFITVDPVDDIEYLLKFGAEDNLIVGTDYGHGDPSANLAALDEVRSWVDDGKVTQDIARKILDTNARTFYGL